MHACTHTHMHVHTHTMKLREDYLGRGREWTERGREGGQEGIMEISMDEVHDILDHECYY